MVVAQAMTAMHVHSASIATVIRVWLKPLMTLKPVCNGCSILSKSHHQLEEAILGLIAGMDEPGSPAGEAITACYALLHARTPAFRKQLRSRLLAVSLEDLQRVAVQYLLEQKPTESRGCTYGEA